MIKQYVLVFFNFNQILKFICFHQSHEDLQISNELSCDSLYVMKIEQNFKSLLLFHFFFIFIRAEYNHLHFLMSVLKIDHD